MPADTYNLSLAGPLENTEAATGDLDITLSTIASNTAASSDNDDTGWGGGVSNKYEISLRSTIIADNAADRGPDLYDDNEGGIDPAENNLIETEDDHYIVDGINFNIVGVDDEDHDLVNDTYEACFRFELLLDEQDWIYQPSDESTILWGSIAAVYDELHEAENPFGWKTVPRDIESEAPDAAVRILDVVEDGQLETWAVSDAEPIHYPHGTEWDLAFELLTTAKHAQPPDTSLPGLHAHDTGTGPPIVLADNWICDGGVVTDLHWYGNYEYDMSGDGIDYFQLSIHANADGDPWDLPLDPDPSGWSLNVPFAEVNETDTGLTNVEGSTIYRYEYVLDEPFVQVEGEKYWFDVTAVSNSPTGPALWRWQEAQRDETPIIDPAAIEVEPDVWESIEWGDEIPYYSDLAFAITSEPSPKWSQPPELYVPQDAYNGWGEFSVYGERQIVADDWRCRDDRPVTDIHWWGSFLGWSDPELPPILPDAFHIGIWTDVPENGDYSHPGEMIWENYVSYNDLDAEFVGWDFDPREFDYPPAPEATFYFEHEFEREEWFWQDPGDNIYWVSISAVYEEPWTGQYPFGWKTLPRDEQSPAPDDAVRIMDRTDPRLGSEYYEGEPIYYPDPENSWDMAFVLTTGPLGSIHGFKFDDADGDGAYAPEVDQLWISEVTVPDMLLGTTGYSETTSTLVELDPTTGSLMRTIGSVGYVVNGRGRCLRPGGGPTLGRELGSVELRDCGRGPVGSRSGVDGHQRRVRADRPDTWYVHGDGVSASGPRPRDDSDVGHSDGVERPGVGVGVRDGGTSGRSRGSADRNADVRQHGARLDPRLQVRRHRWRWHVQRGRPAAGERRIPPDRHRRPGHRDRPHGHDGPTRLLRVYRSASQRSRFHPRHRLHGGRSNDPCRPRGHHADQLRHRLEEPRGAGRV